MRGNKKNKELIKIIYFLFIVIIVLLVIMAGLVISKTKTVKLNSKLNISEDELYVYLNYVPYVTENNSIFNEDAYYGTTKNARNIRMDNIYNTVFDNTISISSEEIIQNTSKCVSEEEFLNNLRGMYNIEIKINNFVYNNGEVKRVEDLYCSYSGSKKMEKTKINKVSTYKISNNKLVINEKALFVIQDGDTYKVYKNTNTTDSKDIYSSKSFEEAKKYAEENVSSANTFIHEFEGAEDSFYYVSTKVKKITE